jgi:hypothetical protein
MERQLRLGKGALVSSLPYCLIIAIEQQQIEEHALHLGVSDEIEVFSSRLQSKKRDFKDNRYRKFDLLAAICPLK